MITLFNVTKTFSNGRVALSQISLHVAKGELIFLKGHSGAGKSTLLRLMALLEPPTRGQIVVNGQNINHLPGHRIPYYRRSLGFISQHPKLLHNYTVFENVSLPLVVAGADNAEIEKRTHAALEKVGLLHKENLYPYMLSEGEQQRVGIARAVVHKPTLLLADEPTGNLDPALSLEIMLLFERFHRAGVTVLIASHDEALIEKFPYRCLHISQGKLISSGSPAAQRVKNSKETIDA